MKRSISGWLPHLCATTALLGIVATTARGDAIPAYSVTDLGTGVAQLAKDAGGDGILIAPDGQTSYAFPRADVPPPGGPPILQALPPLNNAPTYDTMTYGDPKNAYSYFLSSGLFENANGVFVGTDVRGVSGHIASSGSTVDTAQRQADGSFGPLSSLWGSPNNLYTGAIR